MACMRGQARVLDLTRDKDNHRKSFSKVPLLEAAECLTPVMAARGDAEPGNRGDEGGYSGDNFGRLDHRLQNRRR